MKNWLIALTLLLILPPGYLWGQTAELSVEAKEDILFMLEEEKLARDVYRAFAEQYDRPVFNNISKSEQWHMELMKELAEDKGLEIPSTVTFDETGIFQNRDLQKMYDELVRTGSASLEAALRVGAKIEEIDIRDLESAMKRTDDAASQSVYQRLRNASENHLRAYMRNLDFLGITYEPDILEADRLEDILNDTPRGNKGKANCCRKNPDCPRSKSR